MPHTYVAGFENRVRVRATLVAVAAAAGLSACQSNLDVLLGGSQPADLNADAAAGSASNDASIEIGLDFGSRNPEAHLVPTETDAGSGPSPISGGAEETAGTDGARGGSDGPTLQGESDAPEDAETHDDESSTDADSDSDASDGGQAGPIEQPVLDAGTAECCDGEDGSSVSLPDATPAACIVDSDGDGTPDCDDACVLNPNKVEPGVCGCMSADTDDDADGTPNCEDDCPMDGTKTAPGVCGCGELDNDSDGDGWLDCEEECPTDPLKVSSGICGCGVADTNSDEDDLPNCLDDCPLVTAPTTCGCSSEAACLNIGPNLALETVLASGDADSSSKLADTSNNYVRDGDMSTYWSPDNIVPNGTPGNEQRISVKWQGDAQAYDTVILREDGDHVRAWRVETLEGQVLATGTTIGPSLLVQFASVQSERVNLFVVQADALPRIAEIEVYDTQ